MLTPALALSLLEELLLGEECYFLPYGFGLPRAYKLWRVLWELWRFLLEGLFARGLKRKPPGLQEGLAAWVSAQAGRRGKVARPAHRLFKDGKPNLSPPE